MTISVPRWLELQQEIDYLYFVLNQERKAFPRSAIDKAIDEVTGAGSDRASRIREMAIQMKALKVEWSRETGREVSMEMEDAIIRATEKETNDECR